MSEYYNNLNDLRKKYFEVLSPTFPGAEYCSLSAKFRCPITAGIPESAAKALRAAELLS